MSHMKAIQQAKSNCWQSVLIFEDDFVLCKDFDSRLAELMRNVPDSFDILFLHGTYGKFRKPVKYNDYLNKVGELYGAFGYIVNARFYDTVISELDRLKEALNTDYIYSKLMIEHEVYRAIKPLVYHRAGYSYRADRIEKMYKHLLPIS